MCANGLRHSHCHKFIPIPMMPLGFNSHSCPISKIYSHSRLNNERQLAYHWIIKRRYMAHVKKKPFPLSYVLFPCPFLAYLCSHSHGKLIPMHISTCNLHRPYSIHFSHHDHVICMNIDRDKQVAAIMLVLGHITPPNCPIFLQPFLMAHSRPTDHATSCIVMQS